VGDSARLGATFIEGSGCEFLVWAPEADRIEVEIVSPEKRRLPLQRTSAGKWGTAEQREETGEPSSSFAPHAFDGYFSGVFDGVGPGALYFYIIDGGPRRPDPASRLQPLGVHGPSEVTDPRFPWTDSSWPGLPLRDYIIYELHAGAFTREGTFDAIVDHLDELCRLGVTAIELMPAAQFPGNRNWGYDGVYPFAVQNTYGGPDGLKRLVNACHEKGLAVVLDVVYNHLGPEGNYLGDFGPYFTNRHITPWGRAINFDGPGSDEVRRYFVENALYWVGECHIDALRLDALHAVVDQSPYPFLAELSRTIGLEAARLNRHIYLIAESDLNDVRLISPRESGGLGLDAHWNDDFHHALHALLTGEKTGYYRDFGRFDELAKAFREGFVYSGEYSVFRRRRHGSSSRGIPAFQLVVFAQNHDQVGNRLSGDRLSSLLAAGEETAKDETGETGTGRSFPHLAFESLKLAAGTVLLSPFTPLLFMGEEYGETAPFQYFVSHSDPDLIEAVRKGRGEEFASFGGTRHPPDPQAVETFQRSRLQHGLKSRPEHNALFLFYRELIRVRKMFTAPTGVAEVFSHETEKVLLIRYGAGGRGLIAVLHFGRTATGVTISWPSGTWIKELDSAEGRWGGQGSTVPPVIRGGTRITLDISPRSIVLWVGQEED